MLFKTSTKLNECVNTCMKQMVLGPYTFKMYIISGATATLLFKVFISITKKDLNFKLNGKKTFPFGYI